MPLTAAATDKFAKVGTPGTATTLSAPGYTDGASTSINVGSTTNWSTDTLVYFAIDRAEIVAGEEVRIVGTYNEFSGIVSSATAIGNLVQQYGSAQDYPAGSLTRVYIPVSSSRENALVDGLNNDHTGRGYHKTLHDTSANEILEFGVTGSAVNQHKITNAATGNKPKLSASGDDTNIGLDYQTKGSGVHQLLDGNGNEVLKTAAAVASAVNEFEVQNAATGTLPQIAATGGDTDISFRMKAKGAGTQQHGRPVAFYATTAQSIGAGSVDVTTYSEVSDFGANFNPATGVFTAPYAGFYHFDANMGITDSTSGTGRWDVLLKVNGSEVAHGHSGANATNADPTVNIGVSLTLAASDTVSVTISNNTGGTETLVTSNLSGFLVGRTD